MMGRALTLLRVAARRAHAASYRSKHLAKLGPRSYLFMTVILPSFSKIAARTWVMFVQP